MKVTYDREADAMYIRFRDVDVERTSHVQPGIILDYGADGEVVGLEILWASQRMEQPGVVEYAEAV
ncbi:MAG: DUF2283 domain-containing protein [Anaerolineae bacterium]|nr:DUF2283 domain-containing protein [Anaerolineae bacterium]